MMREMGGRCGIRRETDCHRCSSYRGVAGETFENAIGRDFSADAPCPGDPGRAPNCVLDVETDIPVPGGPRLWHY